MKEQKLKNMLYCKDIKKITEFISSVRQNPSINDLFEKLESKGQLILVGGSIRDLVFRQESPRDIDIIVQTPCIDFDNELERFKWTKNSFGGYKVKFNKIDIDFWSIYSSWAFKEGIVDTDCKSITNSSFFNIDSIWLNIESGEHGGYLFESLKSRILDIVVPDKKVRSNPSRDLNILRAFYLRRDYKLKFSDKVISYVDSWLSETKSPEDALTKAHMSHYGSYLPLDLPKSYTLY